MKNANYYTLEEARQIIAEESRLEAMKQAKRRARRKAEAIYYMKQKMLATLFICIGIITPVLLRDVTTSLIMLPFGVYLFLTKNKIMEG